MLEIQHDQCIHCGEEIERRLGGVFGDTDWYHVPTKQAACIHLVATPVNEHAATKPAAV